MVIRCVTGSLASGMQYDSHVLPLAIKQFRKDWPFMASKLEVMRQRENARGPACGEGVLPAGAASASAKRPDGNHGDNNL